jgi:16S rRNA processing protein RimM
VAIVTKKPTKVGTQNADLVAIAKVVKPRGLKGEVIAEILTHFPERFEGLVSVTAVKPNSERLELTIEVHWFQQARIVLKFAGYDSVETAEELRDAEICVAEDEAVELETDEFYDWQLAGCSVETIEGKAVGKVRELMRTGGTELLVVAGDTKDYLIPFAEAICVEVDIDNKLIRIDPPVGLLDF